MLQDFFLLNFFFVFVPLCAVQIEFAILFAVLRALLDALLRCVPANGNGNAHIILLENAATDRIQRGLLCAVLAALSLSFSPCFTLPIST